MTASCCRGVNEWLWCVAWSTRVLAESAMRWGCFGGWPLTQSDALRGVVSGPYERERPYCFYLLLGVSFGGSLAGSQILKDPVLPTDKRRQPLAAWPPRIRGCRG